MLLKENNQQQGSVMHTYAKYRLFLFVFFLITKCGIIIFNHLWL